MSTILTLLRKDLRLLRWPWLGWLGCFLAKLAVGAWCIVAADFKTTEVMRLNLVLTSLAALSGAVLIVWLVQADPVRGVRAFWRTRPISGGQLLAAKSLTAILLFGLAPLLLALPWWLVNGMAAPDLAWSAAELLLIHAAVLAPVFLIAALTDSVGRAVLWSFAQAGALICLPIFAENLPGTVLKIELPPSLEISRFLLTVAVVAVGLPALIAWQFIGRRTGPVVAGLLSLQVLAFGISQFSPYNFVRRSAGWTASNPELAPDVVLMPATAAHYVHPRHYGHGDALVYVQSTWPITGLTRDLAAVPRLMSVNVADARMESVDARSFFAGPNASLRFGGVAPVLVGQTSATSSVSPAVWIHFGVSQEQAIAIKRNPPTLNVGLRLDLYRPEIVFDLPVATGGWRAGAHGALRIADVQVTAQGVRIVYVATQPSSLLRQIKEYWLLIDPESAPIQRHDDYLVHPLAEAPGQLSPVGDQLRILGVSLQRREEERSPGMALREGAPTPGEVDLDAWRAGFRFVRVAYRKESSRFLSGRTEGLVIKGSPEPASPAPALRD